MEPDELFALSAVEVAPRILGALFTKWSPAGSVTIRVTEVEAYLGVGEDPGSHSFRGRTRRNAPMFGPPHHLYAYFTYGMHTCCNIVCSPEGVASAVLLRAGEVVEGRDLASERRGARDVANRDLARGPARLAKALGITLAESGADLARSPFELVLPAEPVNPVSTGPRTGVSGPGGSEEYPWRFWITGDPTVSVYRRSVRA